MPRTAKTPAAKTPAPAPAAKTPAQLAMIDVGRFMALQAAADDKRAKAVAANDRYHAVNSSYWNRQHDVAEEQLAVLRAAVCVWADLAKAAQAEADEAAERVKAFIEDLATRANA
jgi:hypothetical protein